MLWLTTRDTRAAQASCGHSARPTTLILASTGRRKTPDAPILSADQPWNPECVSAHPGMPGAGFIVPALYPKGTLQLARHQTCSAMTGIVTSTTHRQVDDEGNRCNGPGGGNGRDEARG